MKKRIYAIIAVVAVLIVSFMAMQHNGVVYASTNNSVGAKSYIVVDTNSSKILYEYKPHEKMPVASICKLMTSLITLEKIERNEISLDDKFVASDYCASVGGSSAFLDSGCEYTVRELLKSVIVASANDSAIVLAENIAGSEQNFVKLMNNKAKELGMNDTLYANSTGLTEGEQYSTAYDISLLIKEVGKHQIYLEDSHIWMDNLIHPSGRKTELVNTNRLIRYYPYCITGKTGFTDEAGYCLSSIAEKDNMKLTCVVLGCATPQDRFKDSIELYNTTFANYKSIKVVDHNEPIDSKLKVAKGKNDYVTVGYDEDVYVTMMSANANDIEYKYEFNDNLSAPIRTGDIVGKCYVIYQGDIVGSVNIITLESIDKLNYCDAINKIINKFPINNVKGTK